MMMKVTTETSPALAEVGVAPARDHFHKSPSPAKSHSSRLAGRRPLLQNPSHAFRAGCG